jgi:hypothetical protein
LTCGYAVRTQPDRNHVATGLQEAEAAGTAGDGRPADRGRATHCPAKKEHIMQRTRTRTRTSAALAATALALVLGAPGASAVPGAPNENSSCMAKVTQPQAVDAPRTVSDKIHWIQDLIGDYPLGQVLSTLGQIKDCSELE